MSADDQGTHNASSSWEFPSQDWHQLIFPPKRGQKVTQYTMLT